MPRSSSASSSGDRAERLEDHGEVVGDRRDHAEQMEQPARGRDGAGGRSAPSVTPSAGEELPELAVRLGVRAIPARDRERPLVQPEHVAAVGDRRSGEPSGGRDARAGERGREVGRLVRAGGLGHAQLDPTCPGHEDGVVREAGVHQAVGRPYDGDLDSEAREELGQRGVLAAQQIHVGPGEPSGRREVALGRFHEQRPPERRGHGADAPGPLGVRRQSQPTRWK